jgi:hypothetical protein
MASFSEWVCTTRTSTVVAKKIFRSRRSFILDLSFRRPNWQVALS